MHDENQLPFSLLQVSSQEFNCAHKYICLCGPYEVVVVAHLFYFRPRFTILYTSGAPDKTRTSAVLYQSSIWWTGTECLSAICIEFRKKHEKHLQKTNINCQVQALYWLYLVVHALCWVYHPVYPGPHSCGLLD